LRYLSRRQGIRSRTMISILTSHSSLSPDASILCHPPILCLTGCMMARTRASTRLSADIGWLVVMSTSRQLYRSASMPLAKRATLAAAAGDDREVKSVVRFGLHVVGFSVTYTLARAVDRIALGLLFQLCASLPVGRILRLHLPGDRCRIVSAHPSRLWSQARSCMICWGSNSSWSIRSVQREMFSFSQGQPIRTDSQ
jgi:hypothetical protein